MFEANLLSHAINQSLITLTVSSLTDVNTSSSIETDVTSSSSSKREQQQQQCTSKFQHRVYNEPIVLIGCRGAGDELNRLAASIVTKLSSSGSVLSHKDLKPMLRKKSLDKSSVIVLDFDAPDFNVEEGKNANRLKSHLTDLAKELYEDDDMLVVYVNVHPEASEMSKMGRECKELLEESVFIKYSDYELCVKGEGLDAGEQLAAWDGIEWQLRRLLARAFLPPATPGLDKPSSNTAHLTMGQNAFFLSLSFPDVMEAESYIEAMCQDVDAMEFRVDLLACRDDRFELLYSLQKVREMCRPHAVRAPMLPIMGRVIEDSLPVVYTVRTAHQAGTYPDDSEGIAKMFNLLEMGLRAGVEVLDVEQAWDKEKRNDLLTKAEDRYSSQILGSHHVVGGQVSTEEAVTLYRQCSLNGRAHGAKVVLSIEDDSLDHQAEDASKIAHSLAKQNDDPIIPHIGLILGEVGQYSRVLNLAFTPVTHESLPFVAAPGQMTASELMATRIIMGLVPPKKYAILGHNIAYSVSPAMHSAAFAATKLPHSYSLIDMESVEEFVNSDFWNNETFGGASVAIPHKQSIIPHLDVLTDVAKLIGAVNTVIVREKEPFNGTTKRMLVGDNTDWKGIFNPLSRKLGVLNLSPHVSKSDDETSLEGKDEKVGVALILGGDGTACAAAYAASQLGLEPIYYSCSPSKAMGLVKRFGGTVVTSLDDNENAGGSPDSLGSILDAMNREVRVVISTLPAVAEFEIPSWLVKRGKESKNKPIMFDINYKPYWTKLLYQAEGEGFDIVPGSEMLWEEGVGQFELWTGRTAPYKVMKNVVLNNCFPQEDDEGKE